MTERLSFHGWTEPTAETLRKYGLSIEDWRAIVEQQGNVCPVCEKRPSTGRGVIDHDHVKGWKLMPPERRRLYVRGVTCWFCNHSYLGRSITAEKAFNAWAYLERYEENRGGVPWWEDR